MRIARVASRAQLGLAAPRVQVEVHLGSGLPTFSIVGLPATAVKESKDRVRIKWLFPKEEHPKPAKIQGVQTGSFQLLRLVIAPSATN